jgi:hypothetical protein
MESREDKRSSDTQPIAAPGHRSGQRGDVRGEEMEASSREAGPYGPAGRGGGEQDRIPTPVPLDVRMVEGGREPGRSRASGVLWAAIVLCLLISLASLALNAVLITNLLTVRQTFVAGVDQAISGLEALESNGFRYEYHLQQTIPFSGSIPFQQDMVFPFKGNVPIKTTVSVPIDAGILGRFNLDVPIDTSIPIDIQVPIHVDQTFHVETEIPLDMTVPIEISPDDPAIQKLIDGIREWLVAVRESL